MTQFFLIEKYGLYYRPNASGYTGLKRNAGRYDFDEAVMHVGPNGPDGPDDGLCMWAEDCAPEFSAACPNDVKRDETLWQNAHEAGRLAGLAQAAAEVRTWQAFTRYAQERISDEMAHAILALKADT